MKTLFFLMALLLSIKGVYSQTLNPYSQFGYKSKTEYVRTKNEDGIYLANNESGTKVKSMLIGLKTKQIYFLDEKDSITQTFNVPENVMTKFLSIDPLTKKYPELTPYQFASNTPIQGIDLDGLEIYLTTKGELLGSFGRSTRLRVITDATIQKQIIADASTSKKEYPANYAAYHTSLTVLNTSMNMLGRAEATTIAQGFAAVVTHQDEVVNGTMGAAFLSREATADYMITPESYPPIASSANIGDNAANTTIIHSHAIGAFAYSNATNSFSQLPYGTNIQSSPLFGAAREEQVAYNAMESLTPSPKDVSNIDNTKGYNWILIGNISPIKYNANTGSLSQGTTGAIFYRGNISTESFRLNGQELNNLRDNAEIHTAAKDISNYVNRPQ